MKLPVFAADYRNFRLQKIHQEEFRHLLFLLIWPAIVLRYVLLERFLIAGQYYDVHFALDSLIPFQEIFLIPYVIWYVFIIGVHLYTCLFDIEAFRWYSNYLLVSFTISTLTFLLFPTSQNLRPAVFPRDNLLTEMVKLLYSVDTNTNVCPSEHVIGSIAAFLAVRHTKSLQTTAATLTFAATAFLTSISTVFLKQHSIIDVIAAIPVCMIAGLICKEKRDTP